MKEVQILPLVVKAMGATDGGNVTSNLKKNQDVLLEWT